MNNKRTLKIWVISGIIILIVLALGTIGYMYTKGKSLDNVFVKNVYIEDLAVGGLTKEEAKIKLEQDILDEMSQQTIVIYSGALKRNISLSDLGMTYNIDEMLEQAYKIGHEEGLFEKYKLAKNGVQPEKHFELERTLNEVKIKESLIGCKETFYKAPINATLERKNRQFITTHEVNGQALDVEATYEKVVQVLSDATLENAQQIEVEAVLKEVPAECTEASLQEVQTLVASFSTSYNNASPNRNANLKVACDKITTMLLADETFKLSDFLEPFTTEAGYKNAAVIVNGKVEDGIGGGVCQVASTLYNAILLTDLEVVMRQNHSLSVSYVPLGRDATYSTDAIDFRFRNNSGYPIFVEGYCEDNQVIINLYGHKSLKSPYDIKFHSQLIETIPAPPTVYKDDANLEIGKQETETTAIDGKRVKLYKIYYQNGREVKRVLVNTSYYRPRAAVIKRGTKKVTPPDSELNQNPEGEKPLGDAQTLPPESLIPLEPSVSPELEDPSTQPVPEISTDDSGFAIVQQ